MRVFISFSEADKALARKLSKNLESLGISAFLPSEVEPGHSWSARLAEMINESRAVIFLLTRNSRPGGFQRSEWAAALQSAWDRPEKKMIPVVVGDAPVPAFLENWHSLRVREAASWKRVAQDIEAVLRAPVAPKRLSVTGKRTKRLDQLKREARALRPARGELVSQLSIMCRELEELGASDPGVPGLLLRIANARRRLGQLELARKDCERALQVLEGTSGSEGRLRARAYYQLGLIDRGLGKASSAIEFLKKALEMYKDLYGPNDIRVARTQANLALLSKEVNREAEADVYFRESIHKYSDLLGSGTPTVTVLENFWRSPWPLSSEGTLTPPFRPVKRKRRIKAE